MPVTIEDVARLAGVSRATASRVLGGYGYAGDEARQKVEKAAAELHYRPHFLAKSMVTGYTRTIGLIVADIENPFFAKVARGASDVLAAEGYDLIVSSTGEDVRNEARAIEGLLQKQVDGLIIAPVAERREPHFEELVSQEIPFVLVDRPIKGLKADCVAVSNREGAYEAVRHLIDNGFRNIGILKDNTVTNAERFEGYQKALAEAGLQQKSRFIRTGIYTIESGFFEASSLLDASLLPDALFAANNFMTNGLLLAIRKLKPALLRTIGIVSFDDMDWFELTTPTISAVAQPTNQLGRTAAERLLRRIEGEGGKPQTIRLPTQLTIRESSLWRDRGR